MKYVIKNNKDNELYIKDFASFLDCKHWVINTLDLSKKWVICDSFSNIHINYNFEDYIINSIKKIA